MELVVDGAPQSSERERSQSASKTLRSTNPHTRRSTHHDHISIIGSGTWRPPSAPSGEARQTIEFMSRNTQGQALADRSGKEPRRHVRGKASGRHRHRRRPVYRAVEVVAHYAMRWQARSRRHHNPFNADGTGLVTTAGNSMSSRLRGRPRGTHLVKAFNTIFGGVLAQTAVDCSSATARGEGTRRGVSGELGHAPSTQEARDGLGLEWPASYWWACT